MESGSVHTEPAAVTRADLENGFRLLGLSRGAAVEVHASLSGFGRVEGGAGAVIDALMRIVGQEGAVVMSAYPLGKPLPLSPSEREKGILAKARIYDEAYAGPTGLGRIADEFRLRPGTVLGIGIHRVCAWGRDAERHSRGYAHLLEVDGLALLLGVGIDRCSSMHLAEKEGLPPEIAGCFKVPDDIRREYPADIHIAFGQTPENGWSKVLDTADRRGLVRKQKIGRADCLSFKARDVVGIYETALRTDPLGLFGIGKP
jgi:aminoglycoside N3'-acetyltransferase